MKKLLRLSLGLLIGLTTLLLNAQKIEKPNVIIILTDDQGYKDVGFNGSTDIPTPLASMTL